MSAISGFGATAEIDFRKLMLERFGKKDADFGEALGECLDNQSSSSNTASATTGQSSGYTPEQNTSNTARYNSTLGLFQLPEYMVKAERGTSIVERT